MDQQRYEDVSRILILTNDGDDLSPLELKLLEHAANGFLNEKGEAAFAELVSRYPNDNTKPQKSKD